MSASGVDELLRALTRAFSAQAWRTKLSIAHLSRGLLPGEFRSPRLAPSRSEPHVPRVFLPEDDAGLIDMRSLSALESHSLPEALFNEQLRLLQSEQVTETEFVTIVDLSCSMLGGCFEGNALAQGKTSSKVAALYQAVCLFQSLAESAGFAQRVILAQAGRVVETHRARSPRDYATRTMLRMNGFLGEAYVRARDGRTEKLTTLKEALGRALADLRVHNVIFVISDFLDPVAKFGVALQQLAARHHVVLVDVAHDWDNEFPKPGSWAVEALRVRRREGARHLEEGTEARPLSREKIDGWNETRRREQDLLARFRSQGVEHLRFFGLDHLQAYTRAYLAVSRIP